MPENQTNMFEENPDGKLEVRLRFKNQQNIQKEYPQLTTAMIERVLSEMKPNETFKKALERLRREDTEDSKEAYR